MFLHIRTFDRQISFHSKDTVPEIRDKDGNVTQTAKNAEPLKNVIQEALNYWKFTHTDYVVLDDTQQRKLDVNKTAAENGLKENDLVIVAHPET